ncbi:MAG: hypothetical protein KGL39_35065, partial [Patescibacteria group bacterium]|nr:hypothetical protein [Patescibacteria group bacterium]
TVTAAAGNGFRFCMDGQTPTIKPTIVYRDFSLYCTAAIGCGTGLASSLTQSTLPSRFLIERVDVTYPPTTSYTWTNPVYVEDFAGGRIMDSRFTNPLVANPAGSACVSLKAVDGGGASSEFTMFKSWCSGFMQGVYLDIASTANAEGLRFIANDFQRINDQFYLYNEGTTGNNQLEITDHQGQIYKSILTQQLGSTDTNTTGGWNGIHIRGGWFYWRAPDAYSGALTAAANGVIDTRASSNIEITGMTVTGGSASLVGTDFIKTGSTKSRVDIHDNNFMLLTGNPSNSWVNFDAATQDARERSNSFNMAAAVAMPGYATNVYQASDAYTFANSSGKCRVVGMTRTLDTNARKRVVRCSDSVVGTMASSNLAVTYPLAFTATPYALQVTNGSYATCTSAFVANNESATGFNAYAALAACATSTARVNYSVEGQ